MTVRLSRLTWVVAALVLRVGPVAAQTPPTGTIEYYHVDALGSVRAVTDQSGAVVRTQNYHPFGEGVGVAPGGDPMGFTGKPRDGETGLDYFGARYYGQRLGRFTTVDPVLDIQANLVDPQRWNRYSYGLNNPATYVDPDGRNAFRFLELLRQTPSAQRVLRSPLVRPLVKGVEQLSDRLLNLVIRGGRQAQPSNDVWKSIEGIGRLHSGTSLPTEFTFRMGNTSVQVAQNATKHIFEHLVNLERSGASAKTLDLAFQVRLSSLQSALGEALAAGINHREMITVGGWELMFAINRGKTILIHALPK